MHALQITGSHSATITQNALRWELKHLCYALHWQWTSNGSLFWVPTFNQNVINNENWITIMNHNEQLSIKKEITQYTFKG